MTLQAVYFSKKDEKLLRDLLKKVKIQADQVSPLFPVPSIPRDRRPMFTRPKEKQPAKNLV